jgi:hypothetical protein
MIYEKQAYNNATIYDNGNQWLGTFHGAENAATNTIDHSAGYPRPTFYYSTVLHEPVVNIASPSNAAVQIAPTDNGILTCVPIYSMLLHSPKFMLSSVNDAIVTGSADTLMEAGYETTGPWLAQRNLYAALCDSVPALPRISSLPAGMDTFLTAFVDTATDSVLLTGAAELLSQIESGDTNYTVIDSFGLDTLVTAFFAANETSDFNAIQASLDAIKLLSDTITHIISLSSSSALSNAWSALANIPSTTAQDLNFITVMTIYLNNVSAEDTVTMDTASLNSLESIAVLCPYTGGDAVYYARALYAQYVDSVFFDDLQLCPIDSADTASNGSYKSLTVSVPPTIDTNQVPSLTKVGFEFAKVYPNPAKELLNLAFYANTTGTVEFDLMDPLGEPAMQQILGSSQTFAQFSTGGLSSGLYYWVIKDSERIIKTGKVAIMQ